MPPPGRRVHLHRALSKLGLGSRGEAWAWIVAGRVRVEGRVVREPLTWVDLSQAIPLDGERPAKRDLTVALHKPAGVVTTRRDERGRRTVFDLLPAELGYLIAAGRLDADSEGLLILTSDGPLAARLTDPARHVPKTYHVSFDGTVGDDALAALRRGVLLSDGPTRPASFERLPAPAGGTALEVVLTEGRNRQIRRMVAAVGFNVRRLVRVRIGRFDLGALPPGAHAALDAGGLALLEDCHPGVNTRQ
ncbi:MAG: pseudouridine synthase [Gemmataceae bacterium]